MDTRAQQLSTVEEVNDLPLETDDLWLAVWGLYCDECERRVRDALLQIPGVLAADVDRDWMGARVTVVSNSVNREELIACIGRLDAPNGYRYWAEAGPEVDRQLGLSWQLRNGQPTDHASALRGSDGDPR